MIHDIQNPNLVSGTRWVVPVGAPSNMIQQERTKPNLKWNEMKLGLGFPDSNEMKHSIFRIYYWMTFPRRFSEILEGIPSHPITVIFCQLRFRIKLSKPRGGSRSFISKWNVDKQSNLYLDTINFPELLISSDIQIQNLSHSTSLKARIHPVYLVSSSSRNAFHSKNDSHFH